MHKYNVYMYIVIARACRVWAFSCSIFTLNQQCDHTVMWLGYDIINTQWNLSIILWRCTCTWDSLVRLIKGGILIWGWELQSILSHHVKVVVCSQRCCTLYETNLSSCFNTCVFSYAYHAFLFVHVRSYVRDKGYLRYLRRFNTNATDRLINRVSVQPA